MFKVQKMVPVVQTATPFPHLLLLLLPLRCHSSAGEALKCNYCTSEGGSLCTPTSVQTCTRSTNACGAIILTGALGKSVATPRPIGVGCFLSNVTELDGNIFRLMTQFLKVIHRPCEQFHETRTIFSLDHSIYSRTGGN